MQIDGLSLALAYFIFFPDRFVDIESIQISNNPNLYVITNNNFQ